MSDTRKIRVKCIDCKRIMNSNSIKPHWQKKHGMNCKGTFLQFMMKIRDSRKLMELFQPVF